MMIFPEPPAILDTTAAKELYKFLRTDPALWLSGVSLWSFETMTPGAAE